jgi:hypothetical protein
MGEHKVHVRAINPKVNSGPLGLHGRSCLRASQQACMRAAPHSTGKA